MKLTNRQLLNSIEPLTTLNTLKLPVKTSFKVAKVSKALDGVLQTYRETLQSLQDRFAEKDENGEKVVVDQQVKFSDPVGFNQAFQELLDCETDVTVEQISLDSLGTVEVEPNLFYHLDWLIED